jgi:Cu/Ag efflux pump CusA
MTALAFIIGLMPLGLATGAGANSRIHLGYTVLGGMLAATIFGITVFGTFPDTLSLAGLSMLMVSGFATLLLRR